MILSIINNQIKVELLKPQITKLISISTPLAVLLFGVGR
jgi:hypothetical protein